MNIPKQENIKEEIDSCYNELDRISAEKTMIVARINMLRQLCKHPEKISVVHTGYRFKKCTTCGEEW